MALAELSSRAIIGRYYKRLSQNSGMGWLSLTTLPLTKKVRLTEAI